MTQEQQPALLTREELAAALGVHKTTVYRLAREGRIPFVLIGSRGKRYDLKEVMKSLSGRNVSQTK
jgi:excisionase family DNA binding protein